jgi:hypothetical protein
MAFECLTGQVPFKREKEIAVAMAHLKDAPPSAVALRPELPPAVDTVIAQGMAKDREARYATCDAFITDLHAALGGDAIAARPVRSRPSRRVQALVGAGLVGLVLVIGLVLAPVLGGSGSSAPSPSGSAPVAIASPSAEPASTPTVDPSIFPNSREQGLLALLPAALGSTCSRGGARADVEKAGFNGRIIVARAGIPPEPVFENVRPPDAKVSLACLPTDGADALYLQIVPEVSDSGAVGGEGAFHVNAIAQRYKMPQGDCAAGKMVTSSWSVGGTPVPNGLVACNPKSDFDGHPWIYWSFGNGKVLAFATRHDTDYPALFAWWKNLTLFLK